MANSKIPKLAVAVTLTFFHLAFSSISQGANAQGQQGLFVGLPKSAAVQDMAASVDPTMLRSRIIKINWDMVTSTAVGWQRQAGNLLTLNLFEDSVFEAVLNRREVRANKSFTWLGHVEGIEKSEVTLVVEDGVMVGNIRVAGAYFQVRYITSDLHVIQQIDESRFPPDGEPVPVVLPAQGTIQDFGITAADDGSTFDVMVVYTPAARAAAGGTAAMNALINLAVAETNTAYLRSGVVPRLRLVRQEEVNYAESTDPVNSFLEDLNRLTNPSDGFMDNVHALRNTYGADMVSLFRAPGSLCGIAWLMTTESNSFEAFAFSVVALNCATGNFTFGHEMGHNMGLHHDRADTPADGVFPFSHGYVDTLHNFRDIMGTQRTCLTCVRIQNFSNPNVFFNGFPTGVSQASPSSADSAASLNATRFTVTNWRTAVIGHVPVDFDGEGKADIAVYQTSTGNWFVVGSSAGFFSPALNFGGSEYIPVPGDYDGDGETDAAVYQSSTGNWFVVGSTSGFFTLALNFGGLGFVPVPGDYDGDGRTDAGVYEAATGNWFVVGTSTGFFTPALNFGGSGFIPVAGDYDGDGKTDAAVYQMSSGNWFVVGSSVGFFSPALNFGGAGYLPVPGDYDGDGETDAAVYEAATGNWFVVGSTAGFFTPALNFGGSGYIPVPGDYDGDGETDAAVYQTSTGNWFVVGTTAGFFSRAMNFGGPGFVPVTDNPALR